jgi:hypothetical protein
MKTELNIVEKRIFYNKNERNKVLSSIIKCESEGF